MPLRLLAAVPQSFVQLAEAVFLGAAFGWNTFWFHAALISDADWSKITGPHGVAFIAVCAVIVLWSNKMLSDRNRAKELAAHDRTRAKELAEHDIKEDKRREQEEINKEKRHAESLAAAQKYAESVQALSVESMKVTMKVEHTLSRLIEHLGSPQQVEVVNENEHPVPTTNV